MGWGSEGGEKGGCVVGWGGCLGCNVGSSGVREGGKERDCVWEERKEVRERSEWWVGEGSEWWVREVREGSQ